VVKFIVQELFGNCLRLDFLFAKHCLPFFIGKFSQYLHFATIDERGVFALSLTGKHCSDPAEAKHYLDSR
jgi:hypothetical protein